MRTSNRLIRFLVLVLVLSCGSAGLAEPWRFAVVGDTRGASSATPVNTTALGSIVQSLLLESIDLVLVPGDLVYGSSTALASQLSTWRTTMAPIYNAGIAVHPIRGNHETSGGTTVWRGAFPELPQNGPTTPSSEVGLTYWLTHNDALFVGFDEYVRIHRVNQTWFDGLLSNPDRPLHLFVFGHEPAYASNHADCMDDYPIDRNNFWNSVGNAGGRMYFCGHDHFYARASIADAGGHPVQQLIVGGGGAPFHVFTGYTDPKVQPLYNDDDHFGYLIVEVDGGAVSVEYKAQLTQATPTVFTTVDQFSYVVPIVGDIDGDGHVDVVDLLTLAGTWALSVGDPGYDPAADLNGDDTIDVVDLLTLAESFGKY